MRSFRLSCAALAALCPASAGAQEVPGVIAEPIIELVSCDYGENNPRLPSGAESRAQLYDLFLGQRLREPERRQILAALKVRYPGAATDAFVGIAEARPYDSDESVRTFEAVARRLGGSADADSQVEAARARWMLVRAWRSRHVGEGEEGEYLDVSETYRRSASGRRWSRLLDEFLRDYRGRGPAFDEFVAEAEYLALSREVGDLSPGEHLADGRLLESRVAELRNSMRRKVRTLIPRFEASPNERVQRIVADARDMLAPYGLGRAELIPIDRDLIDRYRGARDIEIRAQVNGAYERLKMSLEETGRKQELAAVTAEHQAWKAANYEMSCTAPRPSAGRPAR